MACADFTYSPNGRSGIGVNQPQSGLHYPFVQPSSDVRHLVADFYLAYADDNNAYNHPLRLSEIRGIGCDAESQTPPDNSRVDLTITDSVGQVVLNTNTAAYASWDWGAQHPDAAENTTYDYRVHEWVQGNTVCRLVTYQTWVQEELVGADEDVAKNYPTNITPVNGALDERSVYKMPKRTRSITVVNGANKSAAMSGVVTFKYGYNTTLEATAGENRGLRATNSVTLNTIPGAGAGKYFDCPDTPENFVYSINGITGPNILITAADCLFVTTPTTTAPGTAATTANCDFPAALSTVGTLAPTLTPNDSANNKVGHLLITSNCPACCGCNDYVQVANYMNRTADRYRPIGATTSFIVDKHEENIARWLEQTECRLARPLTLAVTPQRCPFLDVVAQYCNQCSTCAKNVILEIKVTTGAFSGDGSFVPTTNTPSLVCGRTNITTPNEGTRLEIIDVQPSPDGPQTTLFYALLGLVDIGNAGKVEFRLRFQNSVPTAVLIDLTATSNEDINNPDGATPIRANCGDDPEPLFARLSTALLCDESGGTTIECN